MVADARDLLATAPADLDVGIGLDYGMAFVGNVGSGPVKDFTAIGDVVNTAARLQAAAGSGEIVLSGRVKDLSRDGLTVDGQQRVLSLRGKSDTEHVLVLGPGP